MAVEAESLRDQLAGLDALELAGSQRAGRAARLWSATWPKAAAVAIALLIWQVLVWVHWRPEFLVPSPPTVFKELGHQATTARFWHGVTRTMQRALIGYGAAVLIGSVLGAFVSRIRVLRTAVGSMITGLQTMPSIAWFPMAIAVFGLSEQAIFFVVVLGAAPSIANGLIAGVDHVPPLLLRSGRMLGARRLGLYRHVILPASLPAFVAGLKQGWAFTWRSLMAGELLVIIAGHFSIGSEMQNARDLSEYPRMYSWMIVILILGIVADTLFGAADTAIRRRWGLIDPATS
jgi:NitT/TauT family transport system permease protein